MPADDSVGPDESQGVSLSWPHAAQNDPEETICGLQAGPRPLGRENGELLAMGEVLQPEVGG
jgi:hypothetical protein